MSVLLNATVCFWNFLSFFLPPVYVSVFQSLEICWLCSSFSTCGLSPFFPENLLIWAMAHTSPLALENLNSQMHFTWWRSFLLVLSILDAKNQPWKAGFQTNKQGKARTSHLSVRTATLACCQSQD